MKKLLILLVLSVILLTGCNSVARNWGGTITIDVQQGQKLVDVTWKEDSLWYLTKPMLESDFAETYTYRQDTSWGIMEGTVIFVEHK